MRSGIGDNLGDGCLAYAISTKQEIESREAIEKLFNVTVEDLQVLNVKGKTKRTSRGKIRQKSNWKKAYVKLAQGQEIDFATAV
jgi:large subunit ribosomal protein L23